VWRTELEAYARERGLSWREDPTNARFDHARNVLRGRVLPEIERLVAPGARQALVRLADLAREDEAGWESVLPGLLMPLGVLESDSGFSADCAALAALHPAVRARVLRALISGVGGALNEDATRRAVEFVAVARSGQSVDLGAGLKLRRDLDRIGVARSAPLAHDRPLVIPDPSPGSGNALLAGRDVPVAWGRTGATAGSLVAAFDVERLRFPLSVRARAPGDRIRLGDGPHSVSKKVKKLLLERRIPQPERARMPLVIDAGGEVLWIPGVAKAASASVGAGDDLCIGIG
jgi:tRNA(Ile)-lysidine synthase